MATAERDESIGNFLVLGIRERDVIFLGDRCTDRRAADGDAAGEEALALHVKQVAGFGTDIDN